MTKPEAPDLRTITLGATLNIKLVGTLGALIVAALMFYAIRSGAEVRWTPYYFASDAHLESDITCLKSCTSADKKRQEAFYEQEITPELYTDLADMAKKDETLRPYIREAFKDGRVTVSEWNTIIDVNDAHWAHYHNVQNEKAKEKAIETVKGSV